MLEYWKETRDTKKRIKAVQERLRRRGEVEDVQMIGYAVATDRFELEGLNNHLKKMDTERWRQYAIKRDVAIPPFEEYWEVEGGEDGTPRVSYLTVTGKMFIKESVTEKRALFWKRWSPLIAIIISLIALIVSILK